MATVTKGRTFVSGETVTPAKLNDLVDQATVTGIVNADIDANAAIALSKLNLGSGITSSQIADGAVTGAAGGGKLAASAITGQTQLTDPLADGDEFLVHDTSASALRRVAYSSVRPLTFATSQSSTSGTAIDFTGIPSWARRITVMLNGVSTNGTSAKLLQIGDSGGIETSGYLAGISGGPGSGQYTTASAGIALSYFANSAASSVLHGAVSLLNITGNTWVASGTLYEEVYGIGGHLAASKTLSATLDRIRVTTVNGTDTFDAGTINIAYE